MGTKSKHVWKAKENWRYTKDSKFRRICMKRLRDITPKVLVSNIPEGKTDQLKKFIIESGYTVSLVELADEEEALSAVAHLHNSWPKKFGTMKNDRFGNARGLVFSLAGKKLEKEAKA